MGFLDGDVRRTEAHIHGLLQGSFRQLVGSRLVPGVPAWVSARHLDGRLSHNRASGVVVDCRLGSKQIATEVLPRVALPCFRAGCTHVPAKLGALRVLGLPARFHTAVLLLLLAQRRDGECWRGRNRADGVSLLRLVAHHLFWRLLEFRLEAVLQKA